MLGFGNLVDLSDVKLIVANKALVLCVGMVDIKSIPLLTDENFSIPNEYTSSAKSINSYLGVKCGLQVAERLLYPFTLNTVKFVVPPLFKLTCPNNWRLQKLRTTFGFTTYAYIVDEQYYYHRLYDSDFIFKEKVNIHKDDSGFLTYCDNMKSVL